MGILTSVFASVLEFSPVNKRVAFMRLEVAGGKVLFVVVVAEHRLPSFLGVSGWCPEGLPSGDPKVLLRYFSAYGGNDGENWRGIIGMNDLPELKELVHRVSNHHLRKSFFRDIHSE